MSAGVSEQRMKGQGNQVSNGSKEQLGTVESAAVTSEEFQPWRNQPQLQQPPQPHQQQTAATHTTYGTSGVPITNATDIYNINTGYYGNGGSYPYQAYGVNDGTWSNGTDMAFLSGYPHDSYAMDGMFGASTAFSTPTAFAGQPSSFNYFQSNGDYNTWGSQLGGQRKYDDYYRDQQNMYTQAMQDNTLKGVDHNMQNLEIKPTDTKEVITQQKKTTTWASIASQPAKPQLTIQNQGLKKKGPGMPPGPIVPGKHNMDIGTWDTNKSTPPPPLPTMVSTAPPILPPMPAPAALPPAPVAPVRAAWTMPPTQGGSVVGRQQQQQQQQPTQISQTPPPNRGQHPMPHSGYQTAGPLVQQSAVVAAAAAAPPPPLSPPVTTTAAVSSPSASQSAANVTPSHMAAQALVPSQASPVTMPPSQNPSHPVLDELKVKNNYNPTDFDLSAPNARFFVIKSYSEDDIHRSIKYEIWCSTEHGNKRLDQAFKERESNNGCVYLFFSVNGSGHFCGMAQMMSYVDYHSNSSVWSQDKWKGQFKVNWIYVKDVPNLQLRHIRLENNENKSVTNSRDTQEVPYARGLQVLRIMHSYPHTTSIFDDFIHYEKRQEEEDHHRKQPIRNDDRIGHHNGNDNRSGGSGGGGVGAGTVRDHQYYSHHHHHHQQQPHNNNNNNRNDHRGGGNGGGGGGGRDRDRDRDIERSIDNHHRSVINYRDRDGPPHHHHHSHHHQSGGSGGGGGGGGYYRDRDNRGRGNRGGGGGGVSSRN